MRSVEERAILRQADELEPVPPRKSFSKAMRARVFSAGKGRCYLCQSRIVGPWEVEHVTQREFAGPDPDRLENLKPAHVDCHKPKTKRDAATRAHVRRMREKNDPLTRKPSKRPLQSRPFDKTLRKKMDGTVERRDTRG